MSEEFLWSRGFLLIKEEIGIELPRHWELIEIEEWKFYYDSRVDVGYKKNEKSFVLIFGDVVSPEGMEININEIAHEALEKIGNDDDYEKFNQYYFNLVGRFLLLYYHKEEIRLRQDAGGSRSIFYMENSPGLISSHLDILTKNLDLKREKFSFLDKKSYSKGVKCFPGNVTPRLGAVQLTPNLDLVLSNNTISRFFPYKNLPIYKQNKTEIEIINILNSVVELLVRKYESPIVSLTAGIDSRLTCSVCVKFNKSLKFFTYYNSKNKIFDIDLLTSRYIAMENNLNHYELDRAIETEIKLDSIIEIKRNSFLNNGKKLSLLYQKTFSENDLHIRSNMGEIGRSVFRRNHGEINIRNGKDMCKIWKPGLHDDKECNLIFEKFYNERWSKMNSYDLDLLDLFYWEHRMGMWHSNALNESDIAFGTINLFSSHKIIELLLSYPVEMRKSNESFLSLVGFSSPGMENIPINSKIKKR